jgi:hypothetical protein
VGPFKKVPSGGGAAWQQVRQCAWRSARVVATVFWTHSCPCEANAFGLVMMCLQLFALHQRNIKWGAPPRYKCILRAGPGRIGAKRPASGLQVGYNMLMKDTARINVSLDVLLMLVCSFSVAKGLYFTQVAADNNIDY